MQKLMQLLLLLMQHQTIIKMQLVCWCRIQFDPNNLNIDVKPDKINVLTKSCQHWFGLYLYPAKEALHIIL